MMDLKAQDIKDWVQYAPAQLSNSICKGQNQQVTYFVSIVQKQGRTISCFTNTRILILMLWKNRTHTLGYIDAIKQLPPWKDLPHSKYQKDLALIKNIDRDEKQLKLTFKDQKYSWNLQLSSPQLAAAWRTLLNKYKVKNLSVDSQQFQFINLNQDEQDQGENHTILIPQLQILKEGEGMHKFLSRNSEQISQMPRQQNKAYIESLQLKINAQREKAKKIQAEKQKWLKRQAEMGRQIDLIKTKVTTLQNQKQAFQNAIKNMKREAYFLEIDKLVLQKIQEQYSSKYREANVQLLKQKAQNIQLRHICSRLYQERKNDKQQLKKLKQQLNVNQQKVQQGSDETTFLDFLGQKYKLFDPPQNK